MAGRQWRGVSLLQLRCGSGVVQLVALQTLDLAILVRVQAPEPIHWWSQGDVTSANQRKPLLLKIRIEGKGLREPSLSHGDE